MSLQYFVVYKPFGVLSQFSGDKDTLKTLGTFPEDVYPVGRLDKDSEGLLVLTNDKALNHSLLDPAFGHERTYWVQVEGEISAAALKALCGGLEISVNGKKHLTAKASAKMLENPEERLPERDPPIRFRKNVPESWIALTLNEGKNRQVRKMTAKVGFPTLRLVRWSIGDLDISGFQPGEFREMEKDNIYHLLGLDPLKSRFSGSGFPKEKVKTSKKYNKRRI